MVRKHHCWAGGQWCKTTASHDSARIPKPQVDDGTGKSLLGGRAVVRKLRVVVGNGAGEPPQGRWVMAREAMAGWVADG